MVLLSSLVLFPWVAHYRHRTSLVLYTAVFCAALVYTQKYSTEHYKNKMDFFPWNEVNLVKKRSPESTVIDCAWRLDQKDNPDIFYMDDPVLSHYSNLYG
jgi:hypothetical protein